MRKCPWGATIAMEPAKAVSEYKAQIDAKDEEISDLQKALGKATIKAEWQRES